MGTAFCISSGCLQLVEIWSLKLLVEILENSWKLVDTPGKFYVIFARQAIFSALYVGKSSGKWMAMIAGVSNPAL